MAGKEGDVLVDLLLLVRDGLVVEFVEVDEDEREVSLAEVSEPEAAREVLEHGLRLAERVEALPEARLVVADALLHHERLLRARDELRVVEFRQHGVELEVHDVREARDLPDALRELSRVLLQAALSEQVPEGRALQQARLRAGDCRDDQSDEYKVDDLHSVTSLCELEAEIERER